MRDLSAAGGLLVLHLALAMPGAALLCALGLVDVRPRALMGAAGPAFLAGLVLVGVIVIAGLTAGLTVGVPAALAVALVLTVVIGLFGRSRHRRTSRAADAGRQTPRVERIVALGALIAVAATFVLGTVAFKDLPVLWDDAHIWSMKGIALYEHDALIDDIFRNGALSYVHLDYPLLQPQLEAWFFHAMGGVDLRLWHVELWIVSAAAIWTIAWLLWTRFEGGLWLVVVGAVALSPLVSQNVTLGDADATMAGLLGCGALALGIWLSSGRAGYALLGVLLLGGAANVKNEGLAFGVAIAIALLLVVLVARVRVPLRLAAAAAAIAAGCVAPWLAWVSGNDAAVRATQSPWQAIQDLDGMIDRLDLFWRGLEQVAIQLSSYPTWGLLVPAFLVVAAVLIGIGVERRVAAFYLGAWFLAAMAIAYTYWVTPIGEIDAFEQRTGPRIVMGVAFIAGVGLAHLLAIAAAVAMPAAEAQERDVTSDGSSASTGVSDSSRGALA